MGIERDMSYEAPKELLVDAWKSLGQLAAFGAEGGVPPTAPFEGFRGVAQFLFQDGL
jgi:hypothetical protein